MFAGAGDILDLGALLVDTLGHGVLHIDFVFGCTDAGKLSVFVLLQYCVGVTSSGHEARLLGCPDYRHVDNQSQMKKRRQRKTLNGEFLNIAGPQTWVIENLENSVDSWRLARRVDKENARCNFYC